KGERHRRGSEREGHRHASALHRPRRGPRKGGRSEMQKGAPQGAPFARSSADCRQAVLQAAIAFFRFSSILSRKPLVVSHFWSGPTSSARSLVMWPDSTVSMQTFSRVAAKFARSLLSSS